MATATVLMSEPPNMASPFAHNCPQCGFHLPDETLRVRDLEAQVKLLNSKAASAVDKLADYEDEIRYLRDECARAQSVSVQSPPVGSPPLEGPGPALAPSTPGQPPQLSRLASLSSFLPGRRKDPSNQLPVTPASGTFPPAAATLSPPKTPYGSSSYAHSDQQVPTLSSLSSLQSSLDEERTLRLRAESNLSQTQTELEELTATLFGQANEMVATERKARAKLEERVKVLEQRDVDKRKRLERLEKAMARIERVRGLVGP